MQTLWQHWVLIYKNVQYGNLNLLFWNSSQVNAIVNTQTPTSKQQATEYIYRNIKYLVKICIVAPSSTTEVNYQLGIGTTFWQSKVYDLYGLWLSVNVKTSQLKKKAVSVYAQSEFVLCLLIQTRLFYFSVVEDVKWSVLD